MKNKNLENVEKYEVSIRVVDRKECPNYDPFGLCTVDDCMICPNARVKITRLSDKVVMRDDEKADKNIGHDCFYDSLHWATKNEIETKLKENPIEMLETHLDKKFSKFQKWLLLKILN